METPARDRYIQPNLDKDPTVTELADVVDMNSYRFALFNGSTGVMNRERPSRQGDSEGQGTPPQLRVSAEMINTHNAHQVEGGLQWLTW